MVLAVWGQSCDTQLDVPIHIHIKEETSVLKKLYQKLQARKQARTLLNIRQEFAKAGYPLDRFRDSEIKAAVTHWNEDISAFTDCPDAGRGFSDLVAR